MKLFYVILGATPRGRHIEQHDIFFGIAESLKELVPAMKAFWPEAEGKIHIDAWQEVRFVDGYEVIVQEKNGERCEEQLFFVNLGGYKPGAFIELHEHHLFVGKTVGEAVKKSKQTEFYKTMGFKYAESHIDEKYGVDVDDVFRISDILPQSMREKYSIFLKKSDKAVQENHVAIGYLKIEKV